MMIFWIIGIIILVILLLASIHAFIFTTLEHAKLVLETDLVVQELLYISRKSLAWAVKERNKSIISHRQATDIISREYLKTVRDKKIQDKENLEDQKTDEQK